VAGAAVLVIGLLLVLAGLVSARIPGGARARPGILRFVLAPVHPATWYANGAIVLGFFVGVLAGAFVVAMLSAGFSTLLGGIGFVFIVVAIEGSRLMARVERWRVFAGSERPLPHPYRPLRGRLVDILRAAFIDENRWRDVLYVGVNLPLVVLEFVVVAVAWGLALAMVTAPAWYGAVEGIRLPGAPVALPSVPEPLLFAFAAGGLVMLAIAGSLSQLVITLHRSVVTGLLCTSEERVLRREVETLRRSRSAVLDVEATELHRIERDLHDGAQQRLVMLSIDLGLASERIDADPAAAKQLILEGQEQARQALAEIRQLVRGIAPSILLDRGLVPALESISARGPIPVAIRSNLAAGERLPAGVERAAYFVVSEALANVVKHSAATRCEVRCLREVGNGGRPEGRSDRGRLVIEVWDDGRGGARMEPGGGLAGLASRIEGVDGTFAVTSPEGGPTLVRAEIPLAGA
jgi:signal transduction histidine kinase